MANIKEEKSIISAFYEYERKDVLLTLANSPESREEFVDAMLITKDLIDRCLKRIPPGDNLAEKIQQLLTGLGAPPRCYVVSENEELDGKEVSLIEALKETVESGDAAILSCIPGKLAYFEGCTIDERYLVKK